MLFEPNFKLLPKLRFSLLSKIEIIDFKYNTIKSLFRKQQQQKSINHFILIDFNIAFLSKL